MENRVSIKQMQQATRQQRPAGAMPAEYTVLAKVQSQKLLAVWMGKPHWLVLRGSKTPILVTYKKIADNAPACSKPARVMTLGPDTTIRINDNRLMLLSSSRLHKANRWAVLFDSMEECKQMSEYITKWIALSSFLQTLGGFETLYKSRHSIVYRCRHDKSTSDQFVLKRVLKSHSWHEISNTHFAAASDELRPYVGEHLYAFEDLKDQDHVTILMEYYKGGSLADRIRAEGCLTEANAVQVLFSLCTALHHLHKQGIIHLDIKADNIVFDTVDTTSYTGFKLVDFGSSLMIDEEDASVTGTYGCIAPERFDGVYGPAADVYGAGVVFYHMITGDIPFVGIDSYQVLAKNMKGDVHFDSGAWKHVSPSLQSMAVKMLDKSASHRINLQEVLSILSEHIDCVPKSDPGQVD